LARGAGGKFAVIILAAIILAVIMPGQGAAEKVFAASQANVHEAGLAMLAGVADPSIYRPLYPDPSFVAQFGPLLQQKGLSIYASGQHHLLGKSIGAVFGVPVRGQCVGAAFSNSLLRGGIRVGGWAFDLVEKLAPRQIILANTLGTIVGLGQTRHSGCPFNGNLYHGPAGNQWVAFVRRDGIYKELQPYALIDGDRLACPLGEPISIPVGWWADPEELADPIPAPQWHADPAWTVNGFHPSVGVLSTGTAYGSWSGNDANTGKLVSTPIDISGHSCVAVAIAHGPDIEGQSVELQDSDTGKTLAMIPLDRLNDSWRFWAVELNWSEVKQIRITATDNGQAWGQWVAVGQPRWCNPGRGK
jgi:hypothetical protein